MSEWVTDKSMHEWMNEKEKEKELQALKEPNAGKR